MPSGPAVLMTADAVGGVWQYAMVLARGLRSRGARVHVAVMGPPPTVAQRDDAADAGATLHDAAYALEWMPDPWDDVDRAGAWLLDLERTICPALIHLNGYAHGVLPWRAPVLVVGHSCVCSWWRAVHGEEPPARFDTYRDRVRAGIRAAQVVVAPTADMLENLDVEYGPLPSSRVIPNGHAAVSGGAVKERVIFSAGRLWDDAKNIETLGRAARDLEWPVCVAGNPRDPSGVARVLTGVRVLGPLDRPQMQTWYGRARIYALPARYEPFGLSVLEAAQAGCALVLGDIRSLRENWDGAAVFVPPDNDRVLAGALSSLIRDAERCTALGAAAAGRAVQFTVDRMTTSYWTLYDQLAGLEAACA